MVAPALRAPLMCSRVSGAWLGCMRRRRRAFIAASNHEFAGKTLAFKPRSSRARPRQILVYIFARMHYRKFRQHGYHGQPGVCTPRRKHREEYVSMADLIVIAYDDQFKAEEIRTKL